jgi:hypothetical protein
MTVSGGRNGADHMNEAGFAMLGKMQMNGSTAYQVVSLAPLEAQIW